MEFNQEEYYKYLAANEQKSKKKSKKNSGLTVFLVIVGIVVVIGITACTALLIANRVNPVKASSGNVSEADGSDISSLNDNALIPEKDDGNNNISISVKAHGKKELSTVQISKKCEKSVLGITIYSTNGMLESEASGIVLGTNKEKSKTYVVTCAHVISSKDDNGNDYVYRVRDAEGNEYSAAVVGYDESADIGVLSIKKVGFYPAEFGYSSKVLVGESVLSVGNPGGSEFYGSVTKGIVSATNRYVATDKATFKCIQHDSAINPGNSGGALFNTYGQVIGMNYSKVTDTEYEGMGFAIPSEALLSKVKSIIKDGTKTSGAKLGIKYYVAASYVYDGYKQLIVAEIDEGSDAMDKLSVGDFIVAVNSKKIKDQYTLIDEINNLSAGDTVKLTIAYKNKKTKKYDTKIVEVKLVEKS